MIISGVLSAYVIGLKAVDLKAPTFSARTKVIKSTEDVYDLPKLNYDL